MLITTPAIYFLCGTASIFPKNSDLYTAAIAAIIILYTHIASPWRSVRESPTIKELELKNPEVDFSTPIGVAQGLTSGLIVFGVAATANATGFGVFMASASALGAMGASFTTISTSMSVLGFILSPYVFIPLATATGLAVFFSKLKTGDYLLGEAMTDISMGEWQSAYNKAHEASKKTIFTPSNEKLIVWKTFLENTKISKDNQLNEIDNFMKSLKSNPDEVFLVGFWEGFLFSALASTFSIYAGLTISSVAIIFYSFSSYYSERHVSNGLVRYVTLTPKLHAERQAIDALLNIKALTPL
jgi:hypothetical protein